MLRNVRYTREVNKLQWRWPAENAGLKELLGRYKYILLIVLAGAVLLLIPGGQVDGEPGGTSYQKQEEFDLEAMETKLERALSQIQGAGEVTVVLTLKESAHQVLARDTQHSDREESSTTVILSRGSGVEEPVPLHRIYPTYQGALVVCAGGADARVRLQIMEAVRALTGLSTEKISVCKGK